jgi:hypothetical protein
MEGSMLWLTCGSESGEIRRLRHSKSDRIGVDGRSNRRDPSLSHQLLLHQGMQSPNEPPSKRQKTTKPNLTSTAFARKRAIAACDVCRARKLKCDNARPDCTRCVESEAVCVYDNPRDMSK